MKRSYASAIALALTALAAGQVLAADMNAPDQAFADVREGLRTGNIISNQMGGNKQVEPTRAVVEGKAPDQAFADLRNGLRTGSIISNQMGGNKQVEPTRAVVEGKAPDQAFADLRNGLRTGSIISNQMRRSI